MDRRSQQDHIRAARDWLGRAEDSLSQKNDVQGDLKLMLAKAELAHVGQCSQSRRIILWGKRMAAFIVAAGLAIVLGQMNVQRAVPATVVDTDKNITVVHEQHIMEGEAVSQDKMPEQPLIPSEKKQESSPAKNYVEPDTDAKLKAVPAERQPANSPQLPDAAKQQLMQSAGKILRQ